MEPLTDKQKRVLDFIEQEVARWNYPPSVREICKALEISSTATVHGHLDTLENKGYISRMATKPRAIKLLRNADGDPLVETEEKCVFAPLIGRITAGQPILAEENREGYFPVPPAIHAEEGCFVLKVKGESMVDAGIHDGDYVIIRQQNSAENGEIVAALLGDEATVKRFYLERDVYRLQPENNSYEPIYTHDAVILGKVIGLFRKV
ncbi:MAG: transcriptional repressor LexA [Bacillota bacterium]